MIQALAGILAGTGAYLIAADLLRIPFLRTSKAASNLSKRQKKKTSSLELWLQSLSQWIAGKLRLNEYKRLQLQSVHIQLGINVPGVEQEVVGRDTKQRLCVFPDPVNEEILDILAGQQDIGVLFSHSFHGVADLFPYGGCGGAA